MGLWCGSNLCSFFYEFELYIWLKISDDCYNCRTTMRGLLWQSLMISLMHWDQRRISFWLQEEATKHKKDGIWISYKSKARVSCFIYLFKLILLSLFFFFFLLLSRVPYCFFEQCRKITRKSLHFGKSWVLERIKRRRVQWPLKQVNESRTCSTFFFLLIMYFRLCRQELCKK